MALFDAGNSNAFRGLQGFRAVGRCGSSRVVNEHPNDMRIAARVASNEAFQFALHSEERIKATDEIQRLDVLNREEPD
jgi:hypothetical protein